MQAGSSRRFLSFFGALLAIIAGIVLSQTNGGARPTVPAEVPTPLATAVAAIPGATATATIPPVAPTSRMLPTATVAVPVAASRSAPTATAPPRLPTTIPAANDGLPTIPFESLPPEAQRTLELIDRGGPFPYDRDGITFGNREGLLPQQSGGYYREYTVVTPGSADRGARRIIAGRDGQRYYTDDHYESFRRVVR